MEIETTNNKTSEKFIGSRETFSDGSARIDLVFVIDSTSSMGNFLMSLSESLVQIVQIIDITDVIDRVCMIAYKDYCDKDITKSSGWVDKIEDLLPFIIGLRADGGGDIPEAAKTAANNLLDITTKNTIVIWYADAPPHHESNKSDNYTKEKEVLVEQKGKIFDWVEICDKLAKKNVMVYPIINQNNYETSSFYMMMSKFTGGKTLYLHNTDSRLITQVTIKFFLALMGCDYDFNNDDSAIESNNQCLGKVSELVYNPIGEFERKEIINETHHGGYLSDRYGKTQKTAKQIILRVAANPWLTTNLRGLVDLFNKDTNYKNRIYALFESMFKAHTVLALTYNVIFATFWRLICKNYSDRRRDILRNMLSETLEFLKKKSNRTDHQLVADWISDSYNQTFEVNEIINTKAPSKVPALVLDTARLYIPQELLELNRSCNAKVLSLVVDMMSSLRVIEQVEDLPKATDELDSKGRPMPLKYVPLSLPNRYLFSVLPHLIAPGSNFSLRPALIIAIVAHVTNNVILAKRAAEHLAYHKGKWIDFSIPENYSGGFVNLLLKAPEFLTETEIDFCKFYQKVYGLLINNSTELSVQLPFAPFKSICYDYKRKCDYCGHNRSFTLLTKDSKDQFRCGLCYYHADDDHPSSEQKNASFYFNSIPTTLSFESSKCSLGAMLPSSTSINTSGLVIPEPQDDTHSHYLECKSCCSHYALVRPHLMNVTPKCHGCRLGITLSTTKCTECFNTYVDPAGIYGKSFVCPQCNANPKSSIDEVKIAFGDIYNQNQNTIFSCVGFEMPTTINIFGGHSLFALKDQIKKIEQPKDFDNTLLVFKKKPIINSKDVLLEMMKWINSGIAEKGFCMICFNEYSKNNLRQICGRKACKSVACLECLKTWYGENKVGDLIQVNSLACPFCKQIPSYSVLATYNRQVCAMVRTNKSFDINWWYGWCIQCFQPKKVVEKECTAEAPNLNSKFVCDDCTAVTKPDDSKQCPNSECGIAIIKNGGCHHIECTACKKHFCWLCADQVYNTSQEIYAHLYEIHGGAFGYHNNDEFGGNDYAESDSDNDDY